MKSAGLTDLNHSSKSTTVMTGLDLSPGGLDLSPGGLDLSPQLQAVFLKILVFGCLGKIACSCIAQSTYLWFLPASSTQPKCCAYRYARIE